MNHWSDDKPFVEYLITIAVAWRNDDGSIGHRIEGGDEGVNIVWNAWKEGIEEGEQIAEDMGLK